MFGTVSRARFPNCKPGENSNSNLQYFKRPKASEIMELHGRGRTSQHDQIDMYPSLYRLSFKADFSNFTHLVLPCSRFGRREDQYFQTYRSCTIPRGQQQCLGI